MADLAKQVGDLASEVIAADNLFGLAANEPIDILTNRANGFKTLSQALLNQQHNPAAQNQYYDAINQIGVSFWMRGKKSEAGDDSKLLLEYAESNFKESVALGEAGVNPLAVKLWYLGQTESLLGRRAEAAATYGKILAMDQKNYSPLWIEYLRICELFDKDTPEYREAIEQALANHAKLGDMDDYESNLRHELGLSYLKAKLYSKSTEVFQANIGTVKDKDVRSLRTYAHGAKLSIQRRPRHRQSYCFRTNPKISKFSQRQNRR